ncbi:unnamed protein product, partial [Rotaria sp. Silwood2]
ANCNSDEIRCLSSTGGPLCISKSSMYNGVRDCADGSDEDPKYCGEIQNLYS